MWPGRAGDRALVYDPDIDPFTPTVVMMARRLGPLLAALADGRVLIVGSRCRNPGCHGLGVDYAEQYSAEVYR